MKRVIVFTGAGISAESGIDTFRDSGGLWEQHKVEDVATPEAWFKNPKLVMDFYNARRKRIVDVEPNAAHLYAARLQENFDVQVITQNIDDLHERAGSENVLHLHGEILKSRSTVDPSLVYDIKGWELKLGDKCEKGSQLRPHIVWFGEAVPNITIAADLMPTADILIIVGTSLQVYPAAGLVNYTKPECKKYLIDPKADELNTEGVTLIKKPASEGMRELYNELVPI
ncbi:MAG: NAD-dependent deacylase [Flavobacteriales bacterium]|nr:NAD-dependent deacylase [Flavobacteriales bacterium]